MPAHFLSAAERARLNHFPTDLLNDEIVTYFTLTDSDLAFVRQHRGAPNQLGVALQLGTLRLLGFCPDSLTDAPHAVVTYLAQQLAVDASALQRYGQRSQTRTDHFQAVCAHLHVRRMTEADLQALGTWLYDRAQEHDQPTLLLQLAAEKLARDGIVRPGVSLLERLVTAARGRAQHETYQRVRPLLTESCRAALDRLLVVDTALGRTRLAWLRQSMTTNSPAAILTTLAKIRTVRDLGVAEWNLHGINPNRLKLLAHQGRVATNQTLQRMVVERRYPILIAFLSQALQDLTDEAITLFDRCLVQVMGRARRERDETQRANAADINQILRHFHTLADVVLDETVPDSDVRATLFTQVSSEHLTTWRDRCAVLIRPRDDRALDFAAKRYAYLRQFAPTFLATLRFRASQPDHPLLQAITLLRHLNQTGKRSVPSTADLRFVPASWVSFVQDDSGTIHRRYYELCALWELRNALRSGDIWVEESRRYTDPERYLIPKDQWPSLRDEVCAMTGLPADGAVRIQRLKTELETLLEDLDRTLPRNATVRIEAGKLHLARQEADPVPPRVTHLRQTMSAHLPTAELTDLVIEMDRLTTFSRHFTHAMTGDLVPAAMKPALYAALLAQACNLSLKTMARMAELPYERLAWVTTWYLRTETLEAANVDLVNFQYHQPLSRVWGDGSLSSSDGQRFPVSVRSSNATALPRYYGFGRGLTFYTWTADTHAQYGVRVTPSTVRDATYVHDAIRDNQTELPIVEHTTDTHGFTHAVFAIFDLDNLRFSPRIRDLGDYTLYRIDRQRRYRHLNPLLTGTVHVEPIIAHWDELLRVIGSIRLGYVSTSLLLSKWHAAPRQNTTLKVLQSYGRLVMTCFAVRFLLSAEYRRTITRQLNKGELLHAIRQRLFYANEGAIRRGHQDDQVLQATCLTLVTNAVVGWNTVYMHEVITYLRNTGYPVSDAEVAQLSPARSEHINIYGKYTFDSDTWLHQQHLRPIRKPNEESNGA